jgi:hypothetical protein
LRTRVTMAILAAGSVFVGTTTAQSARPKNQAEKDACNAAINWNVISRKVESPLVEQAKGFLVIKHSLLLDSKAPETSVNVSGSDEAREKSELKPDLDTLLSSVWDLETGLIRRVYPSDLHKSDVPHLSVRILPDSGLVAQACTPGEDQKTIQISDVLIQRLREDALQEAIVLEPGPKVYPTKEKLLNELSDFHPTNLTSVDFLHETDAYQRAVSRNVFDAWSIAKNANSIYMRALLFVLAHEASHVWFDRCETPDETRADDYGLLISTTWAAEQFQYAALKAQRETARKKFIAQKKQERKLAQAKLKRGLSPREEELRSDFEAAANLTNDQIARSVDEELGPTELEDLSRPLGHLGFETITLVYVKAGISGDDATHPTFEVRRSRLEDGYRRESLEGEKILHAMYGGKTRFESFMAHTQETKGAEMVGSLFEVSEIDNAKHPECEIQP